MKGLFEMLAGETWEQRKSAVVVEVADREEQRRQDEERRRQEAIREAEAQRRQMTCQAPRIIREIFAAMAKGTLESIAEAQQLLGDRNSLNPYDKMRREVIGEILVLQIEGAKKPEKRRSGADMLKGLYDFLQSASLGFSMAEELVAAFERGDYPKMLEILDIKVQRIRGSLAAAIAYTTCQGKWAPITWTDHGFYALKDLKARAEELLRMRQEAGLDESPSTEKEEPDFIPMQMAS